MIFMSKSKKHPTAPRKIAPIIRTKKSVLLDVFSINDIQQWKARKDQFLQYHWQYYTELARQRSGIIDDLKLALYEASIPSFDFQRWHRLIDIKHALSPLSDQGSIASIGGRFNIGDINPSEFKVFPALYICKSKTTAYQEKYLQQLKDGGSKETMLFSALSKEGSHAVYAVNGYLDNIIDLRKPEKLYSFVHLIRDFVLSDYVKALAEEIGEVKPTLIKNTDNLITSLLAPDWRTAPMQFDIPATNQLFGQFVYEVGIQGILYPSRFDGRECLAIYTQNFKNSKSFIELSDPPPSSSVVKRLDSNKIIVN